MSGKAIIVKGLDFSSLNLGKVTRVSDILVNSITVSGSATGTVGSIIQLSKIVLPQNATNQEVSWSSSNTNIANVSSSGLVSIIAAGNFTITAVANDGSGVVGTMSITGTIVYLVSVLIANKPSVIVNVARLTVAYFPSSTAQTGIAWSSSNINIATVSSTGVVTVLMSGNVTITSTSTVNSNITDSFEAACSLVPVVLVNAITVSGNASIPVGGNSQLSVAILPLTSTDQSVSWSSSNTNIATVNSSGVVTVLAPGSVTITAVANDGSAVSGAISITGQAVLVSGITVSGTASGVVGATTQLAVSILPVNATNQGVAWSSSNTNVATVSASGLVTMVAAGSATITATAADGSGILGTLNITSNAVPVSSISLSSPETSGYVGGTIQLTAALLPANATNKNINWTTSDAAIATVSSTGLVTLIGEGSATITATASDGSGVSDTQAISATISTVVLDKIIISMTAPVGTTSPVYTTNGADTVNLIYPLWGASGVDVDIKNVSGTVIGQFKRNTSGYPADVPGVVLYKTVFNYKSPVQAEVPTGLYPFPLIKFHYLPNNANTSYVRAITRFTVPNGTYTVKLLSCTSSTSYTEALEANCKYWINGMAGVAMNYSPLNNNSIYTTIRNVVVTDGIIDVQWGNTANYTYLPGLNLIELIKNV